MQRFTLPQAGQAHGSILNRLWRSLQAGVQSTTDAEGALANLVGAHDAHASSAQSCCPLASSPKQRAGGIPQTSRPSNVPHAFFPPAHARGFAATAATNSAFPEAFDAQMETESSDGCPASLEEYNDVLRNLSRNTRIDEIRDVYDDLTLDGIAPDRSTYHTTIGACMRARSLQDVLFFYDRMMMQGLIPDATLFHVILKACTRARAPKKAFEIADEMEAVGTLATTKTFQHLLVVCAKAGQVDLANDVVTKMKSKGLVLNKFHYAALIEAIANQKPHPGRDTTGAAMLRMFDEARKNRDAWVDPYEGVSRRWRAGGDHLGPEDDDEESGPARPDLVVYKAALNGSITLYFEQGIRAVLAALREDGAEPDGELMHTALFELVKARDFDQACQLLDDFPSSPLGVTSYDVKLLFTEVVFAKHMPTLQRLLTRQMDPNVRTFFSARDANGLLSMMDKMLRKIDYTMCVSMWEVLRGMDIKPWLPAAKDHMRCLMVNKIPETDPHLTEVKGWIDLIQSRTLSGQNFHTPPKRRVESAEGRNSSREPEEASQLQ